MEDIDEIDCPLFLLGQCRLECTGKCTRNDFHTHLSNNSENVYNFLLELIILKTQMKKIIPANQTRSSITSSPTAKTSHTENDIDDLSFCSSPKTENIKDTSVINTKDSLEPNVLSTYENCILLPLSLIPKNTEPNDLDNIVDEMLTFLRPHEEQIFLRRCIQSFVINYVKRNIGCRVFDSSIFAIRCTLPDDSIKLSLVMSRIVPNNWFLILNDKLCKLSERSIEAISEINACDDTDEKLSDIDEEDISSPHHRSIPVFENNISNVAHTTSNGESSVTFSVDGLLVEITSNPKSDIGLMSFIEEFSLIIGRNYLYKKCLLLVRAWWIYETAAYIGCPMKHYLSDTTLAIMLCAVFNLYNQNIHTPFQGLCIFLAEYGDLDWTSCVITLQGVVPFKPLQEDIPWIISVKPNHVIDENLIKKYKSVLLLSHKTNSPPRVPLNGINSVGNNFELSNGSDESPSILNSFTSQYSSLNTSNQINAENENSFALFERRPLNILNPFTLANMVSEKLNSRRAKRVIKVFQMGARNLCSSIKSVMGSPLTIMSTEMSSSFFRNVYNRFGTGWRPDVLGRSLSPENFRRHDFSLWNSRESNYKSSKSPYEKSILEYLWRQINYCNVVQESILNDVGLIILCKEILQERCTLPVGEIGKNLQEIGKISSSRLKEKFGGLKKFLESFPESFVVGGDHPFNPHVFLRKLITQDDADSIYRGAIPKTLLEKMEKFKKAQAKKKSVSASFSNSLTDDKSNQLSSQLHFFNNGVLTDRERVFAPQSAQMGQLNNNNNFKSRNISNNSVVGSGNSNTGNNASFASNVSRRKAGIGPMFNGSGGSNVMGMSSSGQYTISSVPTHSPSWGGSVHSSQFSLQQSQNNPNPKTALSSNFTMEDSRQMRNMVSGLNYSNDNHSNGKSFLVSSDDLAMDNITGLNLITSKSSNVSYVLKDIAVGLGFSNSNSFHGRVSNENNVSGGLSSSVELIGFHDEIQHNNHSNCRTNFDLDEKRFQIDNQEQQQMNRMDEPYFSNNKYNNSINFQKY